MRISAALPDEHFDFSGFLDKNFAGRKQTEVKNDEEL
jgi:hypothetical protein